MNRFGDQFPKSYAIASQLICHDIARLISVALEQAADEMLGRFATRVRLYEHIDY
jgi:hypothetical protein